MVYRRRKDIDDIGQHPYLHPIEALKDKLGISRRDNTAKETALDEITKTASDREIRETAQKALRYLERDDLLAIAYKGEILGRRKYLKADRKLLRNERKEERTLVDLLTKSIAIVAFIGAIAFIANAGGKPFAITGGAVLEQPIVLGDGLTIGLFLFLLALAIKLISED